MLLPSIFYVPPGSVTSSGEDFILTRGNVKCTGDVYVLLTMFGGGGRKMMCVCGGRRMKEEKKLNDQEGKHGDRQSRIERDGVREKNNSRTNESKNQ